MRLRKRATRINSFNANRSRLRLPNVYDIKAYRSAVRGLQYDPYKRHRFKVFPKRHRSVSADLQRRFYPSDFSDGFLDSRYDPILDFPSEGQIDHRYFVPGSFYSGEWSPRSPLEVLSSPVRVPARIRGTKYIVSPPSHVLEPSGSSAQYLQFSMPRQVLVCVRRKQRREVLLALGRGGGRNKPPKWDEDSFIRC